MFEFRIPFICSRKHEAIAIGKFLSFRIRAINHAWFVYNLKAQDFRFAVLSLVSKCLCLDNISIVVINMKIVFFVTSLLVVQYSSWRYYGINPNNNIDFISSMLTVFPSGFLL